jgi:hypothetical protein
MNLITTVPSGQTKQPLCRIAPGVVEGLANDGLVAAFQDIGDPPGNGPPAKLRKRLGLVE